MQRKLMFLIKSCKLKSMNNKIIAKIFISIYFVLGLSVWAEDGSRVKEFYSPWFIAGTSSVTNLISPQSEAINPASGALTQRVTLDLSYITLSGEESGISGFKGHGINIGNTIPTKAGVFSWSGHYFYSPYPIIDSNSTFTLNGSFSKDLYPDFLVGAGLKLAGSFEPGMSAMLDLGVISLPGNIGFFKDFSWGLALQDIGYSSISAGYPEPFTISAGISANVLKSESLKINASADLDIIGLTNFKSAALLLGSNIVFKDTFSINIGTRLDSYDLVNNNSFSIIPSIGFNYTFKTNIKENTDFTDIPEKRGNKNEVQIQSGFAPVSKNLWAAGFGVNIPFGVIDKSAPVIKLDISGFESDNNRNQDSEPLSLLNNVNKSSFKPGYEKRISLASSGNLKLSSKHLIKDIGNTQSKYTGRYDKNYPNSAISCYMSPNNDGIKDDLTFPINITDSRYLKGYSFIIRNSNGEIVREIKNKEKRIENQGFSGFFARLFAVKSGIEIPEEFRWDGFLDSGNTAEDGLYYFSVEAWDDNGNKGSSDSYAIVLDTTAPEIEIVESGDDEKIFSPNNDGNKDFITIAQSGSDEDLWEASIISSTGEEVRHYNWKDQVPGTLVWDGLDDNGTMTDDGVYSYEIKSIDRAGNSVSSGLTNIIKNTEVTPISITIDKSYFSPNNDMILDTLTFSPEIPVSQGIVSWNLNIKNSNGKSLKLFTGSTTVPDEIIFDGREKDSNGLRLEEGSYTGEIDVLYNNGNHPDAVSPVFYVDVSAPVANIKSNGKIFSPNGDGRKDEIIFYQESSTEINWTGIVKNEKGEIIKEYQWLSAADPTVAWNGTTSEGRLAPDGLYTYQLIAIDRAGNTGQSEIIKFSLNTEETAVILTRDKEYFSPNGDKRQDTVSLIPELKIKEGIEKYTLDIMNKDSNIIRSFSGTGSIPEKIIWNGITSDGKIAKEGSCTARLSITYTKGDAPVAVSPEFIIDTVFPEISISSNYTLFSPNSDGNKDFLIISQSSSSEDIWNGEIADESGNIVRTFFWKKNADSLKWDGKDDEGNYVSDGNYSYKVYSVDKAGNRTDSELNTITIDTEPTNIFLTVSDKYLSPTGNGLFENLTFSTIVNNKKGLASWSLKILDADENIEKEFKGDTGIPKSITWNGLNYEDRIVEGVYHAVFSALYNKGNNPVVASSDFVIDVTPPSGSMKISPVPFSPDNDGVDDEVSIVMDVSDKTGVKDWSLKINDPEGRNFKTYSGTGYPGGEIIWDGKSSTGELVYAAMDYPVTLNLEDYLGNVSSFTGKIPVDVLVVREGDILKIKIANIIFKKNSPELLADSQEVIAKNKFILNRVSELLKKYRSYRITIEGHAVLTQWNNPAAAKLEEENELGPLSEKRAVTVLNYLTKLGISPSRMDSKGMGGKEPLVPHSDLKNRWKNRRVEFILWKE